MNGSFVIIVSRLLQFYSLHTVLIIPDKCCINFVCSTKSKMYLCLMLLGKNKIFLCLMILGKTKLQSNVLNTTLPNYLLLRFNIVRYFFALCSYVRRNYDQQDLDLKGLMLAK